MLDSAAADFVAHPTFFFEPLTPFCADLIVCDPPWRFDLRSAKGEAKSAQAHYDCMDPRALRAMPVGDLAGRDCWLFLWATFPLLDLGIECLRTWGFHYVSSLIWRKVTKNGKPAMGPGYVVRGMAEIVLIGRVGEPHYAGPLEGLFDGERREHSRKPECFYERLERFAPHARKVDLFARQSRNGWLTFGNQASKFDPASEGTMGEATCVGT